MGVVGNAAQPSQQQTAQQNRRPPPQEKSNSLLDDNFKDIEPNTRFPKLWAPPIPEGLIEGPSVQYDVKVSLVKMLAPNAAKFNEEAATDDPIFVGVSFYERETFIAEIEVVASPTVNCPVGSMRTFTTADKNKFGYYGKEVKQLICAFGTLKYPNGDISDVTDPLTVDKKDVRMIAGKNQIAIGKVVRVDVRNKIGRDTQRPFLQHVFSASPVAQEQSAA